MTFVHKTVSHSPFTTSTAYNGYGATAFNEPWITVTGTTPPTATLTGDAIGMTGFSASSASGRIWFTNSDYLEQSASAYYTSFQVYVASIDECIASGSSFSHSRVSTPAADTANSRTNIFRTGF
jgi:hypothetical protein